MACIHKEIVIEASPEHVWAAVRDVGAVHERLTPRAFNYSWSAAAWSGCDET